MYDGRKKKKKTKICVCLAGEEGTGRRDELSVLPVSPSAVTRALCASRRSHVTIFEQLQMIVVCLLFSTGADLCFDEMEHESESGERW